MALDIEKEIKIYWICLIIVLLIYAVLEFLVLTGALFLAYAILLIRQYKDIDTWEKIEKWILFGIISSIILAIVQVIFIIAYNVPILAVLAALIILVVLAIVSTHIWIQKRK